MAVCGMCEERGKKIVAHGWCGACYQAVRAWTNRPIKDKVRRMKNLKKFETRMDFLLGNVSVAHRRKTG